MILKSCCGNTIENVVFDKSEKPPCRLFIVHCKARVERKWPEASDAAGPDSRSLAPTGFLFPPGL